MAVLLQRIIPFFVSFFHQGSITVMGGDSNFCFLQVASRSRDYLPESPIRVMTHIPTLLYTMGQGHGLAAGTSSSISRPLPWFFIQFLDQGRFGVRKTSLCIGSVAKESENASLYRESRIPNSIDTEHWHWYFEGSKCCDPNYGGKMQLTMPSDSREGNRQRPIFYPCSLISTSQYVGHDIGWE